MNAERISGVILKASRWLADHRDADGSYRASRDLAAYYKTPYAMSRLGHGEDAERVLAFVVDTFLGSEGDFNKQKPKSPQSFYADFLDLYMNGWLIAAATLLDNDRVS